MGFQKTISMYQAAGFPGGWGGGNAWAAYAFVADSDITPGTFVTPAPGSNPERVTPGTPEAADGDFLGIALRSRVGVMTDPAQEYANRINANMPVEVQTQGDALIRIANADDPDLAPGMAVFASLADGAPSVAATGSTVAGSRETGWVFVRLFDPAYGLALVSTWRGR